MFIALAAAIVWALFVQLDIRGVPQWFLVATLVAWTAALTQVSVCVHQEGISYRSLLGYREIAWQDLESFYYRATSWRVQLIPAGTHYEFRLQSRQGVRMRIASHIDRARELGDVLVSETVRVLLPSARARLLRGDELLFGEMSLSLAQGLSSPAGNNSTALNALRCEIRDGHICFGADVERLKRGPAIQSVPNVFVLLALIKERAPSFGGPVVQ